MLLLKIKEIGEYYIRSLTKDWTSVWNVKDSAGKYIIKIDGTGLKNILGTNRKEWACREKLQAEHKRMFSDFESILLLCGCSLMQCLK